MEFFGVGTASVIAHGAFQTQPPSRGRRPVLCTVTDTRFRNPGTLGTFVLCGTVKARHGAMQAFKMQVGAVMFPHFH